MTSYAIYEATDQEMVSGPNRSLESQIPIEESEFQLRKIYEKEYLNELTRLRIMFSWYLPRSWMNLTL